MKARGFLMIIKCPSSSNVIKISLSGKKTLFPFLFPEKPLWCSSLLLAAHGWLSFHFSLEAPGRCALHSLAAVSIAGPVGSLCQYRGICSLLYVRGFYWTILYQLHKSGLFALWMFYSPSPTEWHNLWVAAVFLLHILHFIFLWIKRNGALTKAERRAAFWRSDFNSSA